MGDEVAVVPVSERHVSQAGASEGPGAPGVEHAEMTSRQSWKLITDLLGGTEAMRKAGPKWLPKEQGESPLAYRNRKDRSTLFGIFKDTVSKLTAKPFSKSVALKGKAPEPLKDLEKDADGAGRDLTGFLRAVLKDGIARGLTHALVNFPGSSEDETMADDKDKRPTFVHVPEERLISWEVDDSGGRHELTEVTILEDVKVREAGRRSRKIKQLRIIRVGERLEDGEKRGPGEWETFRLTSAGKWKRHEGGPMTLDQIPLRTFYTERTDFMVAESPLEDLAWLNLTHWQSSSDQRHILRFARVPMLFFSGLSDEEVENPITIGPTQAIRSTKPDAKAMWLEHTGKAIEAGENDLRRLEERGEVLGMAPLIERVTDATATGVASNDRRSMTVMQSWVKSLEAFGRELYKLAAEWAKVELPEDFELDVFSDFAASAGGTDAETLLKACLSGKLSTKTFLSEMRRRGILSEDLEVEKEIAAIDSEAPEPPALDLDGGESGNLPPKPGAKPGTPPFGAKPGAKPAASPAARGFGG